MHLDSSKARAQKGFVAAADVTSVIRRDLRFTLPANALETYPHPAPQSPTRVCVQVGVDPFDRSKPVSGSVCYEKLDCSVLLQDTTRV